MIQFSNSTRSLIVKRYNSISTRRAIHSDRTQIIPKTLRALSSIELSAANDYIDENNAEEDFLSGVDIPVKKNRVGKSLESSPVLVLNADYTPLSHAPLSLWSWQDALRAVFNEKAIVVAEYNLLIRSVSLTFNLPSVIALKTFHKKPNNVPVITRRYVYIRDGYRCQYCLKTFTKDELSLDHVIPRSKGGKLTWTNTVCACHDCNFKKSNMLPEELSKIGMKLRNMPHAPTYSEIQFKGKHMKSGGCFHPDWEYYL
eukprot:CAMPEP_0170085340 /NCGR_PEP_ID=MMETSP0019_2-20121128/20255_1 /TAXON_ID=98059 /ORGANISM="Dinobryon sp., Strain UTEXLB2267" /LENGTH=256 /DNA_ID=CAMNT_0010301767 /DNA_START=34 /DNA_END=807 /DNA_ORIENTATION=+